MIKYILKKWDENKGFLEAAFKTMNEERLNYISYKDLVEMICEHVINVDFCDEHLKNYHVDTKAITKVDDGDYQGTLIFLIPFETYQPNESEYFMTNVGYGSCSCCDTLQGIQYNEKEQMIKDYMTLCKDICSAIIVPYNREGAWYYNSDFDFVEFK